MSMTVLSVVGVVTLVLYLLKRRSRLKAEENNSY